MTDAQQLLGRFLEFSIATDGILESLAFYKALGFEELQIGDVWSHKYAVLSDGELNIGLHEGKYESTLLTFVHQDLARQARMMTTGRFDFDRLQLDEDVFNEASFHDRDGNQATLIEARAFSPAAEDLPDSLCGSFLEVSLPVRDTVRAASFWAPLTPDLERIREEPTTHMRFNAGGLPLGLSESIALEGPSLCFRCDDKDAIWKVIAKHGLKFKEFPGYEGAFMSLIAPEGTSLFLFSGDFLGELYEVAEEEARPVGPDE